MVAVSTLDRLEQRADGEVDAGGDDDEGHADRDDAGLRHRAHDIGHVVGRRNRMWPCRRGEKMIAADRHDDEADDALKADGDGEEVDARATPRAPRRTRGRAWSCVIHARHPRSSSAAASTSCSSAPAGNSATVRPRLSTTTRSHKPSSSGISLEAMRTPSPCSASSRMRA